MEFLALHQTAAVNNMAMHITGQQNTECEWINSIWKNRNQLSYVAEGKNTGSSLNGMRLYEKMHSKTPENHPRVKSLTTQVSSATPFYTSGGAGPFCLANQLRVGHGLLHNCDVERIYHSLKASSCFSSRLTNCHCSSFSFTAISIRKRLAISRFRVSLPLRLTALLLVALLLPYCIWHGTW